MSQHIVISPPLLINNTTSPALRNKHRKREQHPNLPRRPWNPNNATPRTAVTTSELQVPEQSHWGHGQPRQHQHPHEQRQQQHQQGVRRPSAGGSPLLSPVLVGSSATGEQTVRPRANTGRQPLLNAQKQRASRFSELGKHPLESERSSASPTGRVSLPLGVISGNAGRLELPAGREGVRVGTSGSDCAVVAEAPVISRGPAPIQVGITRNTLSQSPTAAIDINRDSVQSTNRPVNMADLERQNAIFVPVPPQVPEKDMFQVPTHAPQPSMYSAQISTVTSVEEASDAVSQAGSEFAWGPSHPCFPHLNPHVPLSSPAYTNTRIIRIRRDWMLAGDLAPTFSGLYPEVLSDAGLQETEFRSMVNEINTELVAAFEPTGWRNIIDVLLGVLTGWLWDDFGWTWVKGQLKRIEDSVVAWNKRMEAEGVQARVVGLRRTAYLSLDIEIPTPRIGEADQEEEEEEVDGGSESQEKNAGLESVGSHA